jgi:hypothetical protein
MAAAVVFRTCGSARRLALRLAAIASALGALHVAVMLVNYEIAEIPWEVRQLFDLDEEQSFGTWFSVVILLLAACILLLHAREARKKGDSWHPWWRALGLGFMLLSMDELVGIHESFNTVSALNWTIPGAFLAVATAAAFLPFLRHLPRRTAALFVCAGGIYLAGAIGIEAATLPMEALDRLDTLAYNLTTALEELLEMSGAILFIYALLEHIAAPGKSVGIDVQIEL